MRKRVIELVDGVVERDQVRGVYGAGRYACAGCSSSPRWGRVSTEPRDGRGVDIVTFVSSVSSVPPNCSRCR
jgi:hypothetical protein